MSRFRYVLDGAWYKGNTHLHSTASDGLKSVEALGALYREAGYDFLCLTDHWVASSLDPAHAQNGLLWINGIELDGKDSRGVLYHFVALGDFRQMESSLPLEQAIDSLREQDAFLILAHPFWMGISLEDSERFPVDAVEIYNQVCWRLNGKHDGLVFWHHLLGRGANMLAIASDDAHFIHEPPVWQGGWLVVNTPACTRPAILSALRAGNYYASCGPDFKQITFQDNQVSVETSPVKMIWLVGPAYRGRSIAAEAGQAITTATFDIPQDWAYAYVAIEDAQRRRAWTNTLFVEDESA